MCVLTYFEHKAPRYDEVDDQPYWVVSDQLLWKLLKSHFLPENGAKETLLDAGCGTGRWSYRIWLEHPQIAFKMVDFSSSMLEVAKKKMQNANAEFFCEDLHALSQFSADRILSLHNVLGFVKDIRLVLELLFKNLKNGGTAAFMFPSFYHALYFSNVTGRWQEMIRILKHRQVCYNDLMPPLNLFELDEITTLLERIGFGNIMHYGFPITFYPGMEETYLSGSSSKVLSFFDNQESFDLLLEEEMRLVLDPKLAARGNNILTICKKP